MPPHGKRSAITPAFAFCKYTHKFMNVYHVQGPITNP